MAGSSSPSPSDKLSAASQNPKVKTTEKKKRKRPSKKVPTTVLESSSTNFMNLVQKLTGSAAELAAPTKPLPPSLTFSPALSLTTSTTSSPYSSPSCDYVDPRLPSNNSFYQQLLQNAAMEDDSNSFPNPSAVASFYGEDELYSAYSASSRGVEHELAPFWYQPEMRA
jgi:hypothetical protein